MLIPLKFKDNVVSVVIATLGGQQLEKTVAAINAGSLVPSEILICIPEEYSESIIGIRYPNIRILKTHVKGQVAQRSEGFRQASRLLVLQLDDDIILHTDTLKKLVGCLIELGLKNVIGPVFFEKGSDLPLSSFKVGLKGQLISLYYFIFAGLPFGEARMGSMSRTCVTSSIDPRFFPSKTVLKTQWLPGGCVLNYREDLIVENFFKFDGKAYAEDVLHSYLRGKKGITHHVVIDAKASVDLPLNLFSIKDFIREMSIRVAIVQIMKGGLIRKSLYILTDALRRILLCLRKKSDIC